MSRGLVRVMTEEESDWELLKLANPKGKFCAGLGFWPGEDFQGAFERGIDAGWFLLIDLTPHMGAAPGLMMRVFKLTPCGHEYRNHLATRFQ